MKFNSILLIIVLYVYTMTPYSSYYLGLNKMKYIFQKKEYY